MKNNIIIALSIISVIVIVIVGFYSTPEYATINRIESNYETYIEAKFSEYTCGLDFDGDIDCYTDYWSESASNINYVFSVTDQQGIHIIEYYGDENTITKLSIADPEKNYDFSKEKNFDKYINKRSYNLKVYYITIKGEEDYSTISINNYDTVKEKIGLTIPINTWYGIRRSVSI